MEGAKERCVVGQPGGGWWPGGGPDLGGFPWERGLAFPIQKPRLSVLEPELLAPTSLQVAKAQIKPLVYLLKTTATARLHPGRSLLAGTPPRKPNGQRVWVGQEKG